MQNNFTADKAVKLSGKKLMIQKVPNLNPTFMFKCGLHPSQNLSLFSSCCLEAVGKTK